MSTSEARKEQEKKNHQSGNQSNMKQKAKVVIVSAREKMNMAVNAFLASTSSSKKDKTKMAAAKDNIRSPVTTQILPPMKSSSPVSDSSPMYPDTRQTPMMLNPEWYTLPSSSSSDGGPTLSSGVMTKKEGESFSHPSPTMMQKSPLTDGSHLQQRVPSPPSDEAVVNTDAKRQSVASQPERDTDVGVSQSEQTILLSSLLPTMKTQIPNETNAPSSPCDPVRYVSMHPVTMATETSHQDGSSSRQYTVGNKPSTTDAQQQVYKLTPGTSDTCTKLEECSASNIGTIPSIVPTQASASKPVAPPPPTPSVGGTNVVKVTSASPAPMTLYLQKTPSGQLVLTQAVPSSPAGNNPSSTARQSFVKIFATRGGTVTTTSPQQQLMTTSNTNVTHSIASSQYALALGLNPPQQMGISTVQLQQPTGYAAPRFLSSATTPHSFSYPIGSPGNKNQVPRDAVNTASPPIGHGTMSIIRLGNPASSPNLSCMTSINNTLITSGQNQLTAASIMRQRFVSPGTMQGMIVRPMLPMASNNIGGSSGSGSSGRSLKIRSSVISNHLPQNQIEACKIWSR